MSSMNNRIRITVNRIKACSTDNYKLLQLIKLYNKSLKKEHETQLTAHSFIISLRVCTKKHFFFFCWFSGSLIRNYSILMCY